MTAEDVIEDYRDGLIRNDDPRLQLAHIQLSSFYDRVVGHDSWPVFGIPIWEVAGDSERALWAVRMRGRIIVVNVAPKEWLKRIEFDPEVPPGEAYDLVFDDGKGNPEPSEVGQSDVN